MYLFIFMPFIACFYSDKILCFKKKNPKKIILLKMLK